MSEFFSAGVSLINYRGDGKIIPHLLITIVLILRCYMYQAIYDLIVQYIYNGELVDQYQQLVCTQVSTVLCLFMMALPFIVVFILIWLMSTCCIRAFKDF